ncbi:MAG: sigma 54-interacting transcriptional regulator [Polyangiaceae bacterium]|nr:sigma 54-interacting transcriptional regulator [Polyangiaceae bacterium]MCW5789740.1 sigma 54-interacting transcriptional regulator [Polyangiaceae bacterium]
MDARYQRLERLSQGDQAETWRALDRLLGTEVVLKQVRRGASQHGLEREFEALQGLSHPHLIEALDLTRDGESQEPLLVTRFIAGSPLSEAARQQPLEQSVAAVADALGALRELHEVGIRHGDFKPGNIMQAAHGGVLIDLSCCAPLGVPLAEVSGTLGYLAPELARGRADHRSDLYAVGVTLRELAEIRGEPLSEPLRQLTERLTRPDPRTRPADASEVLELLGRSPAAPQRLTSPQALLGRERELASFDQWLAPIACGRAGSRCLVISGAPGTGRTRLLRELRWRAERQLAVLAAAPRRAGIVADLVAIASSGAAPRHLPELLARVDSLEGRERPLLLMMDDAEELSAADRALWLALCRSLGPTSALATVSVSGAPADPRDYSEDAATELTLGPLGARAVRQWLRPHLAERQAARAYELTSGVPALVQALVAELSSGSLTEDRLASGDVELSVGFARERLTELTNEELRCLALASLAPEEAAKQPSELLARLVRRGLLVRSGADYRPLLGRGRLALERCPAETQRALFLSLAEEALREAPERHAETAPRRALAYARAGELSRVCELLSSYQAELVRSPLDWLPSVAPLIGAAPRALASVDPEGLLRAEALLRQAGRPREALGILARLLRLYPERRHALALRIANAALELGAIRRAERYLKEPPTEPELIPAHLDVAARCKIRSGAHQEAAELAQRGLQQLSQTAAPELRGSLQASLGVASSYLGDTPGADELLGQASVLFAEAGALPAQLRARSYRALVAYRAGRTTRAATEYRAVLELSEAHGLGDRLANAALNYGVACHQTGDLGAALDSYQRGLRLGHALGQVSVTVALCFNLAKLYADVGALDRAAHQLGQLEARAHRHQLDFWLVAAASLRGELALARGEHDAARGYFQEALTGFHRTATRREQAEVELHLAETALVAWQASGASASVAERKAPETVERHLTEARALIATLDAPDVRARLALTEARAALMRGDASFAIRTLEEALPAAEASDQLATQAELHGLLARAFTAEGAEHLASVQRGRARERWERVAASLPRGLRQGFWSAFGRRDLTPEAPAADTSSHLAKLTRLIVINRKLSASLSADEVLALTIDAAIELTSAERGFVLLAEPGGKVRVSVARNVDREKVGRSHLKFSRSIAERAMRTREPVLTIDASRDPRFLSNQSVHAMQLKSVVCVPISAGQETLGALYLDNRFRPANFEDGDMALLLAFADQVAIALVNARLHHELKEQAAALLRRTQELEAERARVAELAEGQAREIDRLTDESRSRQAALESRYDYSQIVGQSQVMARVFAKLDRVIETDATILIEGESGTGKELVARAVHFNSARRAAPFVAVNLSAVPAALLESELFGHKKGAFTGADRDREGLLASARGGTVFLDEIGETSPDLQTKLLRALEDRSVRPVGGSQSVRVDFRLVAATNRRLRDEVAAGRFREDLFYRLSVVEIELPPLRERGHDVLLISERILERLAQGTGAPPKRLSREAARALTQYRFPGNVRELENVLTSAALLTQRPELRVADLHLPGRKRGGQRAKSRHEFQQTEQQRITEALTAHRWNVSAVARALNIPRATLYRKLRRYGITPQVG